LTIDVFKYYSQEYVRKEMYEYARNRWIAIHCSRKMKDDRFILIRYIKSKPLQFRSEKDIIYIIKRFGGLLPRTFYGSANLYKVLKNPDDALNYWGNVVARTPTWDIDSRYDLWEKTLNIARIIIDFLERNNVVNSVYLKWSGNGVHIHVHEKAFSEKVLRKIHPIDLSYSFVQYVLENVKKRIGEMNRKMKTNIKVENLMDPQRVFTIPLSLHRKLDVACIVFKPEEIDLFDISWTNPSSFKHNEKWREYIYGEADRLALKAFKSIGPYTKPAARHVRKTIPLDVQIKKYLPETIGERKYSLENIRLNMKPGPISFKRVLRRDAEEMISLIEDIVSSYVLGKINLDRTIELIQYLSYGIIPYQNYSIDSKNNLRELCENLVKKLKELGKREKVEKWLKTHGIIQGKNIGLDKYMR